MSTIDSSLAPYYDDYNKSKSFVRILANPGKVAQAREFTQVQSMFLDFLSRLGNVVLKSGSIVDGCELTIVGYTATISAGDIYFNGIVYSVPETVLTLTNVGKEQICARIDESIVTNIQDSSLNDPAVGYDNYGNGGADRLKRTVIVSLNDTAGAPIYTLQDGTLTTITETPTLDAVATLLAQRTYDEAGNYTVSGLDLWTSVNVAGVPIVSVNAGKAYVQGYSVKKPSVSSLPLAKCVDTRAVLSEPKVYATGTANYAINNSPVAAITRLSATVQVTQSITRGSIGGGNDTLPLSPVVAVTSVIAGSTTYVQGTDYQLSNNGIDWSLPGAEPAIGTSYTVIWTYVKQMVSGTDYALSTNSTTLVSTIAFTGSSPVNGSTFYTDYTYYLARKDLILLDSSGNLSILQGQSDIPANTVTRSTAGITSFVLGYVYMPPNSSSTVATTTATSRSLMSDISALGTRLTNLEYNMAVSDLETQAMSGQSSTALKGVFTDSFIGLGNSDVNFAGFSAGFDLGNEEVTLPSDSTIYSISPTTGTATINKTLATLPYSRGLIISQTAATGAMLVNPYAVYNNLALVTPSPAYDNWVNQSSITIQNTVITDLGTIRRWWYHPESAGWSERATMEAAGYTTASAQAEIGWGNGSYSTTSATNKIVDSAIEYMRQIPITLTGSNFTPSADNLVCTFGGTVVALTPVAPTVAGTAAGSVRSDTLGNFTATFTIPANTRTGTAAIVVSNASNNGTATFTADGIQQTITDVVTTTTFTFSTTDPLAETFTCPKDCMVTNVGLFFTATDLTSNVIVQLKSVENGYPGSKIYAEKLIPAGSITGSSKGVVETIVTFDDPVLLTGGTQYAVAILSESNSFALAIATLGQTDLVTGLTINKQPYTDGVLFSSSNNLAWTSSQTSDLKFNIYAATFTSTSAILNFGTVAATGKNFDRFLASIADSSPDGTSIDYQVSFDGNSFIAITPFVDLELASFTNGFQLRAVLNGTSLLSPFVNIVGATLAGFKNRSSGVYYSKEVTLTTAYTSVIQTLDISSPSGTSVAIYFSYDHGATWVSPTQTNTQQVDTVFTRYTFTGTTGGTGKTTFRAKIALSTTSSLVRPIVTRLLNVMS